MQITQTINDIINIIFNPNTDGLYLLDFVLVEDENEKFLAQIIEIKADKFDAQKNLATLKIFYGIDENNEIVEYKGYTPTKESKITVCSQREIEEFVNINKTTFPFSINPKTMLSLNCNLEFFENNPVILADKIDDLNVLYTNLAEPLSQFKNVVVFDYSGSLNIKNSLRLRASVDFHLPLDFYSLDYIWDNAMEHASLETQAVCEDIFNEVKAYSKTLKNQFIPYGNFLKVIQNQYKQTPIRELHVLRNRLVKYQQLNLFAKNYKDVEIVEKVVKEEKITIIDFSCLDIEWHREFADFILRTLKNDVFVFLRLNEKTASQNFINQIYSNNVRANVIPSVSYGFKKLPFVLEHCNNYIFLPTLNPARNYGEANAAIWTLTQNYALLFGKDTKNFIFKVQNNKQIEKKKKAKGVKLQVHALENRIEEPSDMQNIEREVKITQEKHLEDDELLELISEQNEIEAKKLEEAKVQQAMQVQPQPQQQTPSLKDESDFSLESIQKEFEEDIKKNIEDETKKLKEQAEAEIKRSEEQEALEKEKLAQAQKIKEENERKALEEAQKQKEAYEQEQILKAKEEEERKRKDKEIRELMAEQIRLKEQAQKEQCLAQENIAGNAEIKPAEKPLADDAKAQSREAALEEKFRKAKEAKASREIAMPKIENSESVSIPDVAPEKPAAPAVAQSILENLTPEEREILEEEEKARIRAEEELRAKLAAAKAKAQKHDGTRIDEEMLRMKEEQESRARAEFEAKFVKNQSAQVQNEPDTLQNAKESSAQDVTKKSQSDLMAKINENEPIDEVALEKQAKIELQAKLDKARAQIEQEPSEAQLEIDLDAVDAINSSDDEFEFNLDDDKIELNEAEKQDLENAFDNIVDDVEIKIKEAKADENGKETATNDLNEQIKNASENDVEVEVEAQEIQIDETPPDDFNIDLGSFEVEEQTAHEVQSDDFDDVETIDIEVEGQNAKDDKLEIKEEIPIYSEKQAEADIEAGEFAQGDRVSHEKYGEGTIVRIIKYTNRTLLQIEFMNIGKRLFDPAITPLKKVR